MKLLTCLLLMLSACALNEDLTLLDVDIRVHDEGVDVYAREVERPCSCSGGEFTPPGSCADQSDGIVCTCNPPPASCLESLRVTRSGQVVAEKLYDEPSPFGYHWIVAEIEDGDELVIAGCGGTAHVPLDTSRYPVPTITDVSVMPPSLHLEWDVSEPPESTMVAYSPGFTAHVCHGSFDGVFDENSITDSIWQITVATLVRYDVTTALGEARVWVGGSADRILEPL